MATKKSFLENETQQTSNTTSQRSQTQQREQQQYNQKSQLTRIKVKYDVGFSNELFLRGKGANLNWDKGVKLKNIKADEWVWETNQPFHDCEFKVLINDKQYETGENHKMHQGDSIEFIPHFHR